MVHLLNKFNTNNVFQFQIDVTCWSFYQNEILIQTWYCSSVGNTLVFFNETAEIKPHVNQILLAPGCPQDKLVAFCEKHDILLEAYSPLGTGTIFSNETAKAVAETNGKSVAQVALRWSLQKGFLPLPKSVTPKNIEANLDIFDFELSAEDMAKLDTVEGVRAQEDPDKVNF